MSDIDGRQNAVCANGNMSDTSIYDSADRPALFIDELVQLFRYRSLLRELVARDIKVRYKRSLLGVAWTLLNPLLTMIVLVVVFSTIFRFTVENYAVYVLSGLILWQFFAQTTSYSMSQMVWGADLLRRIYLPKAVFSVSSTGTGLVNLALALIPLVLIMLATGVPLTPAMLSLPVPVLFAAAFGLGIGLFLSALAVYYADVVNVFEVLLLAWMYLTPIIYPIDILPEKLQSLMSLNPMAIFVGLFRIPILDGALPPANMYLWGAIFAMLSLVIGWWFFTRRVDEFAYRV